MSRHAAHITTGFLLTAVLLSSSAVAQRAAPPNFAPNPTVGWYNYSRQFMPPSSGPGPVVQDPEHPFVTNDEYRVTGRQPTQQLADLSNPILQPWARDVIAKRNALVLAGKPANPPHASCWPVGVPGFILRPMTQAMFFIQTPEKIVMVLSSKQEVRHIYMKAKHSENLKPSWYGESIGHYEGDTLVVDTIGLSDKAPVDGFDTPHTDQLHVVERWRLIDDETLEVHVYVEDPGAFTTPWTAIQRYSRKEGLARRTSVANVAMLASAGEGPLLEAICAENPFSLMGLESIPIAQSKAPDF